MVSSAIDNAVEISLSVRSPGVLLPVTWETSSGVSRPSVLTTNSGSADSADLALFMRTRN